MPPAVCVLLLVPPSDFSPFSKLGSCRAIGVTLLIVVDAYAVRLVEGCGERLMRCGMVVLLLDDHRYHFGVELFVFVDPPAIKSRGWFAPGFEWRRRSNRLPDSRSPGFDACSRCHTFSFSAAMRRDDHGGTGLKCGGYRLSPGVNR